MYQIIEKRQSRPSYRGVHEEVETKKEALEIHDELMNDPLCDADTYYIVEEVPEELPASCFMGYL